MSLFVIVLRGLLRCTSTGTIPEAEEGATLDDVTDGPDSRPRFREEETALGAVVSFERTGGKPAAEGEDPPSSSENDRHWTVDVLANCWPKSAAGQGGRK